MIWSLRFGCEPADRVVGPQCLKKFTRMWGERGRVVPSMSFVSDVRGLAGAWLGLRACPSLSLLGDCNSLTHTNLRRWNTHKTKQGGQTSRHTNQRTHTRHSQDEHASRPSSENPHPRNSSPAASMLPCMLLAVSVSPTPSFSPRGSLRETAHVAGANSTLCDPVQQYSGFYELTTGSAKLEKNCEAARLKLARLVFGLAVRSCSLTASCSLMASCSLTARAPSISTPEKTSTGSSSRAALPRLTRS